MLSKLACTGCLCSLLVCSRACKVAYARGRPFYVQSADSVVSTPAAIFCVVVVVVFSGPLTLAVRRARYEPAIAPFALRRPGSWQHCVTRPLFLLDASWSTHTQSGSSSSSHTDPQVGSWGECVLQTAGNCRVQQSSPVCGSKEGLCVCVCDGAVCIRLCVSGVGFEVCCCWAAAVGGAARERKRERK